MAVSLSQSVNWTVNTSSLFKWRTVPKDNNNLKVSNSHRVKASKVRVNSNLKDKVFKDKDKSSLKASHRVKVFKARANSNHKAKVSKDKVKSSLKASNSHRGKVIKVKVKLHLLKLQHL
jgi:hypothetical protein